MYLETRDLGDMMTSTRGMGAGRQDDLLPAHEAAPHRRAVDGQGEQGGGRSTPAPRSAAGSAAAAPQPATAGAAAAPAPARVVDSAATLSAVVSREERVRPRGQAAVRIRTAPAEHEYGGDAGCCIEKLPREEGRDGHPGNRDPGGPAAQAGQVPVGDGPVRPGRREHLVPERDPARRGHRRLQADDRRGASRGHLPDELLQPERAARQQGARVRRLPLRQRRRGAPLPREADVGGGEPLHVVRVRPRDVPDRPRRGLQLARRHPVDGGARRSSRSSSSGA